MYNHSLIEKKWQKYWLEQKTYRFVDTTKPKYYVLDMFPYPSGLGLHVGHPKGYTATDILSRYKHFNGFDVLHPIGWDAFGLPAEQYALETGNHPKTFTEKNIKHFREQLQSLGFNYDYDKEVDTTDPNYYKWTQWIFAKLYENDLAEIRDEVVNWCEQLGTVLSNEEVLIVDGKMVSERGQYPVIKRPMKQWVLKITKYADKLLDGLNEVNWPESLKSIQRKWIGKSTGALIKFKTDNNVTLEVFTTRPDTIYGNTYLAVAPENSLVLKLTTKNNLEAVKKYIEIAKTKTELQRKELQKDKTGVFTGVYAINPVTKKEIPIYVADYVLNNYATGIIMGVPAHDQRDFDFAKQHKIDIIYVIKTNNHKQAYEGDGVHINSELINGKIIEQANEIILKYLQTNRIGKQHVTYKLKDWLFSRQRYWGEPFPIIFDQKHQSHLITELPVLLPETNNITPTKTGESPLANLKTWLNVTINNEHYLRETNTMPQWAGSCWYYLGYLMKQTSGSYLPLDSSEAFNLFKRWLPVDMYIGGQEHAVLHLLYARFWHRFLYDIKIVPTKEPFQRIVNQGMILGPNGEKMSKSKGNIINPDEIINTHGADALRLYEVFMGPLTASLPWIDSGLDGMRKWLDRVYRLFTSTDIKFTNDIKTINHSLEVAYHVFIQRVEHSIDSLSFNVAISQMMIYINECYTNKILYQTHLENFTIILSCFAPHLAEEIWQVILKHNTSVYQQTWPKCEKAKTIQNIISLPIQENGKLRHVMQISKDASEKEVIALAMKESKVLNFINNRKFKKIIYVKNKILNFIF